MTESTFDHALGKLDEAKHYSDAEEIFIGHLQPLAEEGESFERLCLFRDRVQARMNQIFASHTEDIFQAARHESMRQRQTAVFCGEPIDSTNSRKLCEYLVAKDLAVWVDEPRCIIAMGDYPPEPKWKLEARAHWMREFLAAEDRRRRGELHPSIVGHELTDDGMGIRMIWTEDEK